MQSLDLLASLPEGARPLLSRPDLAYIGITTKRGPHVTPDLFTFWGGSIWIVTARRTLKARNLHSGRRVGVLLRHGAHSLLVEGEVGKLDPLAPRDVAKAWRDAAIAPFALASFGVRNAHHLAGLLGDPRSLPHSPDTVRVPIAIRPVRAAVIEGWRVTTTLGRWVSEDAPDAEPRDGVAGDLPDSFEHASEAGIADAVIGWERNGVALPLPGMWDGASFTASVPSELMALVGAADAAPASVTLERSAGTHIDDKEGMLLRGDATASTTGPVTEVAFDLERATRWDGAETETVTV